MVQSDKPLFIAALVFCGNLLATPPPPEEKISENLYKKTTVGYHIYFNKNYEKVACMVSYATYTVKETSVPVV